MTLFEMGRVKLYRRRVVTIETPKNLSIFFSKWPYHFLGGFRKRRKTGFWVQHYPIPLLRSTVVAGGLGSALFRPKKPCFYYTR